MTASADLAAGNPVAFRAEDIFLAWLFHLPSGADIGRAARLEIARLDREGGLADADRYRAFLSQAMSPPAVHGTRRRVRH